MSSKDNIIDSVRLASHECGALLDSLDKASAGGAGATKRGTKRWRYRNRILASIKQNGLAQTFYVSPRNLSSGGIAFLHGGYVHPGSPIAVALRDKLDEIKTFRGRVTRCSHVKGRLHEVAVHFETRLNPKDFVPPTAEPGFNVEQVDLARLFGKVLVVEDFRPDQRLIAHYFKGTNLDLTYAQSLDDARQALDHATDLVFLDTTLPDGNGVDAVVNFRKTGFAGPVVAIMPERNTAMRSQLLSAGANEVLSKPMDLSLVQQAAAEYLIAGGCEPEIASMLFSTLNGESSRELIEQYVHDCHRLSDTIADAVERQDLATVRMHVNSIRGSAGAHGFQPIDRVAQAALREIDATNDLEESMIAIQAVINACKRAAVREQSEAP